MPDSILPEGLFPKAPSASAPRRVWLAGTDDRQDALDGLTDVQRAWLKEMQFNGAAKKAINIPAADGRLAGIVLGIGDGQAGEPSGPSSLLLGQLGASAPSGTYELATVPNDPETAAIAWGLGAYKFRRYKANGNDAAPGLVLPPNADRATVERIVEAVWMGRDLINTPASDLGPAELEAAARTLAERHDAAVHVIAGDELAAEFPMIHAVGRASTRPPRLIDITWGDTDAPKITLVGKGICFDTGGLDIKTPAGMLIMKKDMGGAAAALALGHMIMGLKLKVRLRILIAAAENSISGNAFRPGDVLRSRTGRTVEIGNTDAEGRLVLADALALAAEEKPERLISFATLTGAARVALGADLPPLFCDDDTFAADVMDAGRRIGDPVWRMPFWNGYERNLDSDVADMNNVSDGPFAGAVTAALFLRRFARQAPCYAHFDIYGWRQAGRPLGPKGGEVHAARAVFQVLRRDYGQAKETAR